MSTAIDSWIPRHRLAEVGLLAHDARFELIEGEIIDMAPIGSAHGYNDVASTSDPGLAVLAALPEVTVNLATLFADL